MNKIKELKYSIEGWYYSKIEAIEHKRAIKKYPDYDYMYDIGDLHHVWGVKSYDDLSGRDCNIHTMNDIEILYNRKTNLYSLSIETAFMFEDRLKGECEYLLRLLKCFDSYMDSNKLSKDFDYCLFMNCWSFDKQCESIEELYFNFKCYVYGLCTCRNYQVR